MAEFLETIESQRGNSFFISDEYRCSKANPLPMYELVLYANCTVAHILEPQTFSNLHSAESEQLDWRKTGR